MTEFSSDELREAHRSIASTLSKCEKAILTQRAGSAQHTLLKRRIQSFRIAMALIMQALQNQEM